MPPVGKQIAAGVRNASGLLWLALILLAACAILSVDQVNDLATAGLAALARDRMAAGAVLAALLGLLAWISLRGQGTTGIVGAVVLAVLAAWLIYDKPDNGTVHGAVGGVQWTAHRLHDFVASLRSWDWHR